MAGWSRPSERPIRAITTGMLPNVLTDWIAFDAVEVDDSVAAAVGQASDLELALWAVVVGALVLDIATTTYGLSVGLVERNPAMRLALDSFGLVSLVVAKAGAVAFALAVRYAWPECALIAPLGLAVPWLLATGINLAVILSA